MPDFDLAVCDEAHRTTGVIRALGEEAVASSCLIHWMQRPYALVASDST